MDPTPIDLSKLKLSLSTWKGSQSPMLLVDADTPTGSINLCDFASAGFDGSYYRSWLRARLVRLFHSVATTRGAASP